MHRILFVVDYYPPHIGGAEQVYQRVAEHMAAEDWEVNVVTTTDPGREKTEDHHGVSIHGVCKNRHFFMLLSFFKSLKLAKECDVIQTATYASAPGAWLAGKLREKQTFLIVHEVIGSLWFEQMNPLSAFLHWAFERFILLLPFTRYIAVSQFTANQLIARGIKREKIEVILNGVDNPFFTSENPDPYLRERLDYTKDDFVLLFFGRPGILKGASYLLKGLKKVTSPNAKLVMLMGSEPVQARIKLEKRAKKDSRVRIMDPVKRKSLLAYLHMADAIIAPSLQEGFGLSVAEACAVGKPVIVSNAGALPEVVSGNVIFVEPGKPKSIADGIQKAAAGEWQEVPKKQFTWEEAVKKYTELYAKI